MRLLIHIFPHEIGHHANVTAQVPLNGIGVPRLDDIMLRGWERTAMTLSFREFLHIGREQRHAQRNPLARLFYSLFGPLSAHARLRVGAVLGAVERLELPANARVFDAGSGYGYTLLALAKRHPDWECTGVELEQRHIDDCHRIAQVEDLCNTHFVCDDLTVHNEQPASFDLIVSGDVLEHIMEDELVIGKLYRWLKPGGWLVLHLPLRHQLQRRVFPQFHQHIIADHVRDEYTEAEIRTKLEGAGFTVVTLGYSYGLVGELAVELNWLFWDNRPLRYLIALITFPLTVPLAYIDFLQRKRYGNGLLIEAYKRQS